MGPGSIIDDRFEVIHLAATGGMGAVYRAIDRGTGQPVAVKVVLPDRGQESFERFEREAKLMGDLRHPGIVGYVARGTLPTGALYLVMEWLEGEDFSARLARSGVLPREAVTIAIRVAEALRAAHARGIVHRDIKPSNIFLEGRDVTRVKVLDFGIATLARAEKTLTRTGTTIGTPGYMAPEQARGGAKLDGRVDLFSLGCVLFEALTGSPPFVGDHPVAVLAKVLLEDPPRVRELMPQLPESVDALVARLLEKDPDRRPRDAAVAAEALADLLPSLAELSPGPTSARRPMLTKSEQRIVSVILAKEALATASPANLLASAETLPAAVATARIDAIAKAVAPFSGRLEGLADGSVIVTMLGRGAITDQVARAARAALVLHRLLPETSIALATGRTLVEGRAPSGEAIDRASALVDRGATANVRVDEITARLIDRRFDIEERDGGLELTRERPEDRTTTATVPCVGRDRELMSLEALFDECVEEPSARAVVVIAAAGVGKSRLRRELTNRLTHRLPNIAVWTARADPLSMGASLGVVAELVREACAIPSDATAAEKRALLAAHVGRALSGADAERVTTFLAEIVGAPFDVDRGIELVAARSDAMLMADQTRRAFEDLVEAETRSRPVLLCLDDLHWGDQASVSYVDHVLRQLRDRPLIVFAAARPEIDLELPGLFADRGVEVVRLGELPKRAAESLVRSMLGPSALDEEVTRVVDRAAGNALYLEELVRAVKEGKGADLPETVLAMVEARLSGLEGDARLVLRAASVFGRVFWSSGVSALLTGVDVGPWLELLCEKEILLKRRTGRFAGEEEHTFRHALFREAAYAMLTPKDRVAGHALAGEWLEAHGEKEPVVLAEHYERGGRPDKSSTAYARAANQALEGNDLRGALTLGEKALVGAEGETRANILVTLSEARAWRGEFQQALDLAAAALLFRTPGTAAWFTALSAFAAGASRAGDEARTDEAVRLLLAHEPPPGSLKAYTSAASALVIHLLRIGSRQRVNELLSVLDAIDPARFREEPLAALFVLTARSWCAMFDGDPEACLTWDQEIFERFDALGDVRNAARERLSVGYDLMSLGAFERAEAPVRDALERSRRHGLVANEASAKHNLGLILLRLGQLEEGERVEREAFDETPVEFTHQRGNIQMYLCLILRERLRFVEARAVCETALGLFVESAALQAWPLAELARFDLEAGELVSAFERASAAKLLLERGQVEEGEAQIWLSYAEVLRARGNIAESDESIRAARERLLARAQRIRDTSLRESFLTRMPVHARTLRLYADWIGEAT